MGEESLDERLHLGVNREAHVRAATQLLGVRIHLNRWSRGQELVVGEIRAQQDQHVRVAHAFRSRAIAQQARHTHVEGIVVLDEVLAAQRMTDRRLECIRQRDHLVVGALDTRTREDRDLVRLVEQGGRLFDVRRIGGQRSGASRRVGGNVIDGLEVGHVTGQCYDGDAAQANRVADRRVHGARRLRRGGNQLVVHGALFENAIRVGLLEVCRTDLYAGNVRGNGQDGCARAVRVVQAVDEVKIARAARTRAHRELARQLSLRRRGKRRSLLVADVNPVDAALL